MAHDQAGSGLGEQSIHRLANGGLRQHRSTATRPVPQIKGHHEYLCCSGKGRESQRYCAKHFRLSTSDFRLCRTRHGCALSTAAAAARSTRATTGSDQVPVTLYSYEVIWSSGSLSTFWARKAATPAMGPPTSAPAIDTVSLKCGLTRTLTFCVSRARSTSPLIATRAAGPWMRRLSVLAMPRLILIAPTISSKEKPSLKTSRKS